MKKIGILLTTAAALFATEPTTNSNTPLSIQTLEKVPEVKPHFQPQFYGQASVVSGPGIALRKVTEFIGYEWNLVYGYGLFHGHHAIQPGFNLQLYPHEKPLYYSLGLSMVFGLKDTPGGTLPPLPLLPITVGYNFKNGFIEAGASILNLYPIPIIRGGISF